MTSNNALRIYTKIVCLSTLFLIFAGGMVTSTGSGLAVPDWPLSYGTLFPPMVGGVFYEHGHRMVASLVGLLVVIQAIWLAKTESRKWVKVLGFLALFAVILQGVLGGLTVLFFLPTPVSVSHATLAQSFFLLTFLIAYTQSHERKQRETLSENFDKSYCKLVLGLIALIYLQLVLGATMRHTGSGLAIPDFPTMGGYWWPPFNNDMLFNINSWRFDQDLEPVTMAQVLYHFVHRLGALIIFIAVCFVHVLGLKYYRHDKTVRLNLVLTDILLTIQIILGIVTVLSVRSPILTSLHVVNGAAFLGTTVLLLLRTTPLSIRSW
ncbi:MAG TPA: COX15/CtaA family protein [Candidatus Omnitrophota bacterium]|nr:COX15/CtaA family protein [Candidatus Omnitrophota bacterium]